MRRGLTKALSLCWRGEPAGTVIYLLLCLTEGLAAPFLVFAVAAFLDAAAALATGAAAPAALIPGAAGLLGAYAFQQLGRVGQQLCVKTIEARLRITLRPSLLKRRAALPYALLEDPETLDRIEYVCGDVEKRLLGILSGAGSMARLAVRVAGIAAILMPHAWWTLPLFLLGAVPIVIMAIQYGKEWAASDRVTIPLTRMHYYLSGVLTGRETAAERTLFGFTPQVNEKFAKTHRRRSDLVTKTIFRGEVRQRMSGLILNLFAIAVAAALLPRLSEGTLTSGLFVSLVGALIQLSGALANSLPKMALNIAEQNEYMRAYGEFESLPQEEGLLAGRGRARSFERIDIKNLRFRYHKDTPYILKGVNAVFEKGYSYSLAGVNGAGKTTLIKVLTGLYRDYEGEILIDGRSIRDFSQEELRGVYAVVYQDFARYALTAYENVTLGNTDGDFADAAGRAGLLEALEKLPHGSETPLGKLEENGADLSGGEWQKLAIARALYLDAPFLILDEPTASLSPSMESRVYREFGTISQGRTRLMISHRLGSAKLSEEILVLDGGVVAERGSHEALMEKGGLYARMFAEQRSWYHEEE